MSYNSVKQGDTVVVIAGADKGKVGVVATRDLMSSGVFRLKISNLSKHIKHLKPKQGKDGGRVQLDKWIHYSNVMLYDEKNKKGSKIRFSSEEGKKIRILKTSGELVD